MTHPEYKASLTHMSIHANDLNLCAHLLQWMPVEAQGYHIGQLKRAIEKMQADIKMVEADFPQLKTDA